MGEPEGVIPVSVWRACQEVIGDATGRAAWRHLNAMQNRPARRALLRALRGLPWSELRTRRIAALGIALVLLARPTERHGDWTGGVVRGVPRAALASLLRDPRVPEHKARVTIAGAHAYLCLLTDTGLVYCMQVPSSHADACELGATRNGAFAFPTNRYWLTGPRHSPPPRSRRRPC